MTNQIYSVWKSLWKLFKVVIYGGVGSLIAYISNLDQTPVIIIAAALLVGIENCLKFNSNKKSASA